MSKNNQNQDIDRGDLKQNLSEKFVWAIAYGSCIGWGAFILPGDWIKQSIAASIGIVIGALLMILIAVSYGLGRKISSFRWRLCI